MQQRVPSRQKAFGLSLLPLLTFEMNHGLQIFMNSLTLRDWQCNDNVNHSLNVLNVNFMNVK